MTISVIGDGVVRRRDGFTLIELSIVVFIMAMLMAVSIPTFVHSYNAAVVRETARSVVTACQFARLNAVLNQQNAVLHIDLDRRNIWVTQYIHRDEGEDRDQSLRVIALSNRVTLVSAQHGEEPPAKTGQIEVTFYPNGTCDAASIVFHGVDKAEALMVAIDPVIAKGTPYPVKL